MKASEEMQAYIDRLEEMMKLTDSNCLNLHSDWKAQIIAYKHCIKLCQKQEKQTRNIFRWLLGYTDFPVRGAGGPYWWRTNLRAKIKKIGFEFK